MSCPRTFRATIFGFELRVARDLWIFRRHYAFIAYMLLENANLIHFQTPGFLGCEKIMQQIPGVIKHAIMFTQAFSKRYLWVDRLCIVQNDLGDGGTLDQVTKMDKIYAGAYLTIIAATPENIYERGLIAEWPSFHSARYLWNDDGDDWEDVEDDVEDDIRPMSEDDVIQVISSTYAALSKSKWAKRGWTYQEQILCRRAVIFMESGFFWDCHCSVWDGIDLLPGQEFEGIALRADMGQRFSNRWWPDFSFCLDLICPYNCRQFSYPQDSILGIQGVLNALGRTFPGGFIHGLPRLFLDHMLLWQPFGTADRRVDRTVDSSIHSSLPSWSWCGWQSYVDPWSLRCGLSYINETDYQKRAGTWRTRNLVEWHLSTEDQYLGPVSEPHMFDWCVDAPDFTEGNLPNNWAQHPDNAVNKKLLFIYAKDDSTFFKHPIPLTKDSWRQSFLSNPAYLTCFTTTASVLPTTVLCCRSSRGYQAYGPPKLSIFEDNIFKDGPPDGKACPVLVLQQPNGAFAGLLRLMNQTPIDRATPLELIAISKGSATARDLRKSFERRIYETREDGYYNDDHGKTLIYEPELSNEKENYALLFNSDMAFNKMQAGIHPLSAYQDPQKVDEAICNFYNIL